MAIAAYSTAYAVGQIFESPCYSLQRMGLTFGGSKQSDSIVMRTGFTILAILAAAYALVAWTPLVSIVFKTIMKVPDEVYPLFIASFRVLIMWPVSSAIRSIFQSRMVLAGKTYWMTAPMGIRVLVMLAAAYFLPGLRLEDPVGAAILVAGISTEALLASIVARFALPSPREVAHDEPAITASQSRKVRFASRNCLDDPDVWQAGPNGSPFADPRPDYHRCRLAGGLEFLVHPGRAHL